MMNIPPAADSSSVNHNKAFIVSISVSVHQVPMKVFCELSITVTLRPQP